MKFSSKKALSVAAITAILSAPIAPYTSLVAEAAQAEVDSGFYIVSQDNKKSFYSINDLFEDYSNKVFEAINHAGFDNVYLLQDGVVNDLNGFFEGAKPTPYEEGVIPSGQYIDAQGDTIIVEKGTAEEAKEFKVLSID